MRAVQSYRKIVTILNINIMTNSATCNFIQLWASVLRTTITLYIQLFFGVVDSFFFIFHPSYFILIKAPWPAVSQKPVFESKSAGAPSAAEMSCSVSKEFLAVRLTFADF